MEYICATGDPDLSEVHIGGPSSPETAAWFREFVDAPNVGFAVCDENLRYIFVNDALAKMNGLPTEAHLGKTIQDVLGETADQIVPMLERVFSTGQTLEFELTAKLPTRTEVGYWTAHFFPAKDAGKSEAGWGGCD